MARWLPIRSTRLRKRRVVAANRVFKSAAVFPLFDRSGDIQSLLLVDYASRDLCLVDEPKVVCVPFWGPVLLKQTVRIVDQDDLEDIGPLWHFDPWWFLHDERFEENEHILFLKATNSVEQWGEPVSFLYYSGNLTRVRWVGKKSASGYQTAAFRSELLPEYNQAARLEPAKSARGWQLAPFWQTLD